MIVEWMNVTETMAVLRDIDWICVYERERDRKMTEYIERANDQGYEWIVTTMKSHETIRDDSLVIKTN